MQALGMATNVWSFEEGVECATNVEVSNIFYGRTPGAEIVPQYCLAPDIAKGETKVPPLIVTQH